MEELLSYQNGNTCVTLFADGTKTREYSDVPLPLFPETLDVKLTDHCNMGCAFCHESSTTKGKHGDLSALLDALSDLPSGVELALGGGDAMSHPGFMEFVSACKQRGWICNLTINQGHVKRYSDDLKHLIANDLIKGVGISITSKNYKWAQYPSTLTPHSVFHVIAGVHEVDVLDDLFALNEESKVLVLGYKDFGFGVQFRDAEVNRKMEEWAMFISRYLGKMHLSFDNLAIEQLDMQRWFTDDQWNSLYMGDDFSFSMYVDAVKQEYSPTSRTSSGRVSMKDMNVLDYFQKFRNS